MSRLRRIAFDAKEGHRQVPPQNEFAALISVKRELLGLLLGSKRPNRAAYLDGSGSQSISVLLIRAMRGAGHKAARAMNRWRERISILEREFSTRLVFLSNRTHEILQSRSATHGPLGV